MIPRAGGPDTSHASTRITYSPGVLNVVTGVVEPQAGSVLLDDLDVTGSLPHQLARLGLVRTFQNLRLFSSLTVRDNIGVAAQVGEQFRPGWPRPTVEELLALSQLWEHRDRRARELDYGNSRRLELARGEMRDAGCYEPPVPQAYSDAIARLADGRAAMLNLGEWIYESALLSDEAPLDFFSPPRIGANLPRSEIVLVYGLAESSQWSSILPRIQAERARVRARAGSVGL